MPVWRSIPGLSAERSMVLKFSIRLLACRRFGSGEAKIAIAPLRLPTRSSITVICTHLSENIKKYAPEFPGRQETRRLLGALAETHPKKVEEVAPKVLSLGETEQVLLNLLRERVPIRDLATILEAITNVGVVTHDVNALTETARSALARTISSNLANENRKLSVVAPDPHLETQIAERFGLLGGSGDQKIEPEFGKQLPKKIEAAGQSGVMSQAIVLCSTRFYRTPENLRNGSCLFYM